MGPSKWALGPSKTNFFVDLVKILELASHRLLTMIDIQNICVCSVTRSCPTLCDPMDCSPPGSSVHEIFQGRILEWVAISISGGGLPNPRVESRSLALQVDSLPKA